MLPPGNGNYKRIGIASSPAALPWLANERRILVEKDSETLRHDKQCLGPEKEWLFYSRHGMNRTCA